MSALVTGASGFLGTHLTDALARRDTRVRALVRRPLQVAPASALQQVVGDLHDRAALALAMQGATTVYHAAGVVPARGSAAMWHVNVDGTRQVALACARAGVRRLVLVSSVAAYGAPLPEHVDESAPISGIDLYGRSKVAAETEARNVCRGRLELVIVRPCQIYGPLDGSGFTGRLLRMCAAAWLPLGGWHGRPFSLVHVTDVAEALCAAGERGGLDGQVFNVAADARVGLLELAQWHAALSHRPRPPRRLPLPLPMLRAALSLRWMLHHGGPGPERALRSYSQGRTHGSLLLGGPRYGIEKAKNLLGYRVRVSPAQGLAGLILDERPGARHAAGPDDRASAPAERHARGRT